MMEAGVSFEPLTWALFVLVSFAGSFISAAWGLGGGAILITVFASILPPVALIPVHGVVQLGSNLSRMLMMRRWISREVLPGFILGAAVGVCIGGLIAVNIPPAAVLIGIGMFVLWSVIAPKSPVIPGTHFVVGGISSVLTMLFGATGPFVAAWIKTLSYDRLTHVATQSTCMTIQHSFKTIVFTVFGFAIWEWWLVISVMIAAGVLGTIAGKKVLMKSTDKRFGRILNVILILLAVRLIWLGVSEILTAT